MDSRIQALLQRSARPPTTEEVNILSLVAERNRNHPIATTALVSKSGLTRRKVMAAIQHLRQSHGVRIGASREAPNGYFLIQSGADEQAALRPYLSQIETMLKTVRKLVSQETGGWFAARLRKLLDLIEKSAD